MPVAPRLDTVRLKFLFWPQPKQSSTEAGALDDVEFPEHVLVKGIVDVQLHPVQADDALLKLVRELAENHGRTRRAGDVRSGPLAIPCSLCGTIRPPADLLFVRDRGAICPGCVTEIQAALGAGDT